MNIEHLNWDSDFFGIKIGKLTILSENDFDSIKFQEQVNDEKYKLVYIFKYQTPLSFEKIIQTNIDLVDIQLTLSKKINKLDYNNNSYEIRNSLTYDELQECYNIADEIAKVSRFYKENLIGFDKTKQLYRKWIDNALNKTFSDGIILTKETNHITGIHIIKFDSITKTGNCSIIGVNPSYKEKGYGKNLWDQAFGYFTSKFDIIKCKVPFSLQNLESFNFHLKMGFNKVEEIKYIYHFRSKKI